MKDKITKPSFPAILCLQYTCLSCLIQIFDTQLNLLTMQSFFLVTVQSLESHLSFSFQSNLACMCPVQYIEENLFRKLQIIFNLGDLLDFWKSWEDIWKMQDCVLAAIYLICYSKYKIPRFLIAKVWLDHNFIWIRAKCASGPSIILHITCK